MKTIFDADLKAQLRLDDQDSVRQILHTEYFLTGAGTAAKAGHTYVRQVAETLQLPAPQLEHLHQQVSYLDPREQPVEYRLSQVKKSFDSSTVVYYQTIHNTPVWDGGMTVTVKENPYRIVALDNRGHRDLGLDLPDPAVIARVREQLIRINRGAQPTPAIGEEGQAVAGAVSYREAFAQATPARASTRRRKEPTGWLDNVRLTHGAFFVYRYRAEDRQPGGKPVVVGETRGQKVDLEAGDSHLTLPLPAVPETIQDGRHYLVAEVVFNLGPPKEWLNWKALVEVETGAILWLRALIAGVNALVFPYDPKTGTGNLGNTANQGNGVLNPLRSAEPLNNLDAPVNGTQSLTGSNVTIVDDDVPTVLAPTQPTMTNFDFDARTNNYAAASAYYHADNLFDLLEDLGFDQATYFAGTQFPVHVDHRASFDPALNGIEVNAFCGGDAQSDGIGLVGFCLSDTTNTAEPLGRSVDKWVHWHEVGGHGILLNHTNSLNFGFAHSAGDSLAAFQNDPESQLRGVVQRFQYAPFRDWPAGSDRWFNRNVADGWAWGGSQEDGDYKSEQILATTLFRMYRSIGGDADQVPKRWHASRVATYLVANAIGKLAPGANANTPLQFHDKLVEADGDDWTTEGLAGGAYKKLIRWSFEKQGLFQAPGAPTPTVQPGTPPAVDLYIDDGRFGEYQYQPVHWANQSVWNRTASDGIAGHEPGVAGVQSYAYVKVKNRGTTNANGTVKVFHCLPGAGLTWPTDFVQAGPTAGLPTGNVPANNGNAVTVGPFPWTPNVNAYGHDCLLAIVETAQDPSNVNNFGPGDTIQEWRLVPHDNNIGQRNVVLAPGGGGGEALVEALDGAFFMAGNNFNHPAEMTLEVTLPPALSERGWGVGFAGLPSKRFGVKPGEKRRIELQLTLGMEFKPDDLRGVDRTISVQLYGDGMLLGGMSYDVDPDLERAPSGPGRPGGHEPQCQDAAQHLLDCLCVGGKVKDVRVRRVSVDIDLAGHCD